jgi:predicted phage tail protein
MKKERKLIRGSGGGGGDSGGVRTPSIAPDSLKSIAFLKILDLICEGEIVGLVNGSKSIYLNKTVLQNEDDSYNFQNVEWAQRRGTQDQDYIPDASATEREINVNAQFKYGNPNTGPQPSNTQQSGTAIVRTIVDPEVDAFRVRISVPALTYTDPSTGDVSGTSVTYAVYVKAADDMDWVLKLEDTILGKSSSRYERTKKIELHGTSPWLIRVQRNTVDAPNTYTQNSTYWESYTEISEAKITYPNSALMGMKIDATQFSSVPSRIYEMDLLKIRIPSNYNDITREYTGTWDGTFQISTGACNNPAWVFYDILTSERYGLGKHISEDQINKWALYEIARYCDELVDDGQGDTEPRFTCNIILPGKAEAYDVLKSLASVFRGMIYWAEGNITAVQDSPKDAVYIYNQSNVIDGKFVYQGTSAKTKYTSVRVTWNDPNNYYQQTVEYVEDQDGVRDYGIIETDIVAVGCTSRGQAHRIGKWLLYTNKYESEIITFSTGLEGLVCVPGDIIEVADPNKAGTTLGGRIKSATLTKITIDRDIDETTQGSILVVLPNGTIEEKNILSIVGREIELTQALSTQLQTQSVWLIRSTEVEPQKFRVLGIQENSGSGTYTLSCLKHNPSKFDFVENNLALEELTTSVLDEAPDAPINLRVTEALYAEGIDVKTKITFAWDRVALAANYRVSYSFNNGNPVTLPLTQYNEIDIPDVQNGLYTLSVVAINSLGKESPKSSIDYEVVGKTAPPQDVEDFTMIPSKGNAQLSWKRATDLDVIIGGYVRIRWTPRIIDPMWANGIDITPALTGNSTNFVTPLLAGTYMIKFVDSSGNYSVNEKLVITDVADIYALNTVQTITEDPDFGGVLTRMAYVEEEQAITLVSEVLIDDVPDIDELGSFDFMGDIVTDGEYEFEDSMDLGGVWPFKVRINVDLETYDTGNYIDQRLDLCDDWPFWDGESINALDAQVYMRTTQDDPMGSPTWTDWKKIVNAEYIAWGAEFKIICTNDEPNHNLYIRELGVVIDMDDRTFNSGKLTSSAVADTHVTFDHEFYEAPSIGITEENGNTGDYRVITNVTTTGFDISFRNSGGSRVVRDFYVIAKGYGLRLT